MAEPDQNFVLGAEMLQKFHFYVLVLTFGILAVSVQTASFDTPIPARIAELLGWLFMLVSGLLGLWFVRGIPYVHSLRGFKNDAQVRARELQMARGKGTTTFRDVSELRDYPIEESIAKAQQDIAFIEKQLAAATDKAKGKQKVQTATFVLGLLALLVARGYGPLLGIICEIRR